MALGRRHGFARAFGDVFPLVRIIVGGLRAGAGRAGAGGAVVLAGERYAVALVGAGLRRGGPALAAVARAPAREAASAAAVMAVLAFITKILRPDYQLKIGRGGSLAVRRSLAALHRGLRPPREEVTARGDHETVNEGTFAIRVRRLEA